LAHNAYVWRSIDAGGWSLNSLDRPLETSVFDAMNKRHSLFKLTLLLWLAFALRVWGLGSQSLWYDEGYSAYLGAHLSIGQALDLTVRDIVPPLYYMMVQVWTPLAGASEYALRFPSALLGMVAVALLMRIGRHLVRSATSPTGGAVIEWSGLFSGALAATAPVLIWLSQDARMYGPLVTWSLFATWGLLRAVSKTATSTSRRRGWALFVGAGLAALYTHTVSAFWLLGQVVFGLWVAWRQRQQRERVYEALLALGLMAVGYLPWMLVALISYQTNAGYWPGYLPPSYLWRTAWETFVGGQHLPSTWTDVAVWWFGVAAILGWVLLLFKRSRAAVYLFCFLVIPLLAMGMAFQHTPKLAPRYPTAMAPALLLTLAVGAAISMGVSRITRYLSLLALLGVGLVSLYADANLFFDSDYAKDDWRAAANYVQNHRRPDEAVILVSGHFFPVFAYYYGWDGWEALPDDVQLDITHVLNYPADAPRLNRMLAGASGAWLVLWQDEVVDPTELASTLLGSVGHELPSVTFRGSSAGDHVMLRHFQFGQESRFPDELPVQVSLQQTIAPGLTALGYSLPAELTTESSQEPLPADAEITARAFWRAEETLHGAHAASLRVYDRLGQEWARQDALLAGPWYFSERWPTSTPVLGSYTVTLPLGTPPGTYTPTLTVYRGDEVFDTLQLASLVITRPQSVPSLAALDIPTFGDHSPATILGELSLVGVGFDQQTVTPCQNWSASLAWRAETRPTQTFRLRLSAGVDQAETPLAVDYPTTRWQPNDVWRTRHRLFINCRALDGALPVLAQLLDADGRPVGDAIDLGELTVVAGRQYTLPEDLTAVLDVQLREPPGHSDTLRDVGAEPAPGVTEVSTLAGYRLEQDRVQAGENLQVTLYWRAGHANDHNYSVFAHLESDQVWAQHDGWPGNGQKPTSTWAQEEVIADPHLISVGANVPPGSYRLVVGMYDAATLQPLAAFGSDGQPIEGGRIVLESVVVYVP
jgi:uncharacterized membrane protein